MSVRQASAAIRPSSPRSNTYRPSPRLGAVAVAVAEACIPSTAAADGQHSQPHPRPLDRFHSDRRAIAEIR
jgi:hypothetical protein